MSSKEILAAIVYLYAVAAGIYGLYFVITRFKESRRAEYENLLQEQETLFNNIVAAWSESQKSEIQFENQFQPTLPPDPKTQIVYVKPNPRPTLPDPFFLQQQREQKLASLKKSTKKQHKHRVKSVLIVAEFRTGSTFFSEMFNQHPDVFYLYEPPSILAHGTACFQEHCDDKTRIQRKLNQTIYDVKHQIVKDFFDCNLPWAEKFIEMEWLAYTGTTVTKQWQSCLEEGICHRGRNRLLTNSEYCPPKMQEAYLKRAIQDYEFHTGRNASVPNTGWVLVKFLKNTSRKKIKTEIWSNK